MNMHAYQERVVTEKRELDERADRLEQFIKSRTLPAVEQERMRRQLVIMRKYSEVLGERIAAF